MVTLGSSMRMLGLSLGLVGLIALACVANTSGTGSGIGKETEGCVDGLYCDDGLVCMIGVCVSDPDEAGTDDGVPVDCGNGEINPGEDCDGAALGGASCMSLGWDHGALDCAVNCQFALGDCDNDPQPGPGELYSACLDNADCPGLDGCLTRVDPRDPLGMVVDGFCTNFCTLDDECAGPTGGGAVAVCRTGPESTHCALDCAGGLTCPGGMACSPVEPSGELCF